MASSCTCIGSCDRGAVCSGGSDLAAEEIRALSHPETQQEAGLAWTGLLLPLFSEGYCGMTGKVAGERRENDCNPISGRRRQVPVYAAVWRTVGREIKAGQRPDGRRDPIRALAFVYRCAVSSPADDTGRPFIIGRNGKIKW